jgi:hypothetical protein
MKQILRLVFLGLLILAANVSTGQSDLELHRKAFPTVNFSGPEPAPDPIRTIRNKRFEHSANPAPLSDTGSDHVSLIMHDPYLRLPAVPKSDSDVIVRGTIADAKAFLSEHRSTAYSEFTVQPIEYFKGEDTVPNAQRFALPVIRQGANVQFRSGTSAFVRAAHQAAPKVGSAYILFLKRDSAGNDFDLLTAYLAENGKIVPLDPDPNGKYATYNNVDESVLLTALK